MKRIVAFVVIILTPAVGYAIEPHDFRGVKLGMTLAEFRNLPFPDEIDKVHDSYPDLICTGDRGDDQDALRGIGVYGTDVTLGVIICRWIVPPNHGKYRYSDENAVISVADYMTDNIAYEFIATPEAKEPRLFEISVGMSNQAFEAVLRGLTEKFGKPKAIKSGKVQNKIGNTFSNTTAFWSNGVSTISIEERSSKIDRMSILYRHTKLLWFYDKEKSKLEVSPAKKL